jgi:molybdopterin-containing oxidoreductase family iron-sulfur binding subunit
MKHHVTNREYWRSLEELADSPAVREQLQKEFPGYDPEELVAMSRRGFMRLMGASLAMAGVTLSGCRRWPEKELAPYTAAPRDRIPGVPEHYATIMELNGVASPLLVTSYDGRPIKIEGNPSHPFSQTVVGDGHGVGALGSADALCQASVLELYDPDRSREVVDRTVDPPRITDWDTFFKTMEPELASLRGSGGAGLAVLSESTSSPTTLRLKAEFLKAFPQATWHEFEPISHDNELAGAKLAVGQSARTMLHLDKAKVVVSFDADLLGTHPAHTKYAIDWSSHRRTVDSGEMNRLFIAESTLSITGTVADSRLAVRPSRIGALLSALAVKVGAGGEAGNLSSDESQFIDAVAADLSANHGAAVVAVGSHLPAELHALCHVINDKIGAMGSTVALLEVPEPDRPHHLEAIQSLASAINDKKVKTLLILGGNPVFDAPAELNFAQLIPQVPLTVRLGLYEDETSLWCKWHLPRAHYLESWGDGRAWDGTPSVQQPMIEPLYGGKSVSELLALLLGQKETDGRALVQATFGSFGLKGDFETAYRQILHDGWQRHAANKPIAAQVKPAPALAAGGQSTGLELRFMQGFGVYDGRFANSGWLQEMPDPITKVTWDNPAYFSKKDADELDIATNDMVTLTIGDRSLDVAAYVLPGQPIGVIGLPLGYGRTVSGNIGNDVGFNSYSLRTSGAFYLASDVSVKKAGGSYTLAMTMNHYLIDEIGFDARQERIGEKYHSGKLIQEASLAELKADPDVFHHNPDGSLSLKQLFDPPMKFNDPHAWGMAVDMNSCIGCNACVVACQAENNIPIVGKEQVNNGRAMHWIRIDRYFKGEPADPNIEVVYQPMMCQHCENAPCEQVCPVAATVHDTEGLNTMVYNRCIGTRYCSNNCPYKVRRFNYLDWQSKDPRGWAKPWLNIPDLQQREMVDKIKRMVFNPEVSVRMRGVMEKCTYCVQRIHNTKIAKEASRQELHDGDIVTACQQACPTQAIVFGDLNDPDSRVTQLHKNNRSYKVLDEELNTSPRTRYLAKVRNPSGTEQSA